MSVLRVSGTFLIGALVLCGCFAPAGTHAPIMPTGTVEPSGLAGQALFEAPGISFTVPSSWMETTDDVAEPQPLGRRLVARFSVDSDAVQVRGYAGQLPGIRPAGDLLQSGDQEVIAREISGTQGALEIVWFAFAPNDAFYSFSVRTTEADAATRRAELVTVIDSLRTESWSPPHPVIDGKMAVATPHGFTVFIPIGWRLYYPEELSTVDYAVFTAASSPIEACAVPTCERFMTAPDSVVLEFRVGSTRNEPDWSRAARLIAGQPALEFGPWTGRNATGADQGTQWQVHLGDSQVLTIIVSVRGDNPDLHEEVERILSSIELVR